MRKTAALCALLLALALLLSACAGSALTGTWVRSNGEVLDFRPNGVCRYTDPDGQTHDWLYAVQGSRLIINMGDPDEFEISGDTLTLIQGNYRFEFKRR
ncbi:MAG: hypothetical protein IKP10_07050 [Clostridia bacterium]|nr:hypothetical protein [Clostridia bacterium]